MIAPVPSSCFFSDDESLMRISVSWSPRMYPRTRRRSSAPGRRSALATPCLLIAMEISRPSSTVHGSNLPLA